MMALARAGSASLSEPGNLARDSAENSHVRSFQAGPSQQAAQPKHHVVRILIVEEVNGAQSGFQLFVHGFDLLRCRQDWDTRGLALQVSDVKLIAHDHHSLGEIDAVSLRLSRDPQEHLTTNQVVIDQACVFRTKNNADSPPGGV